jgi:hypothetical protein
MYKCVSTNEIFSDEEYFAIIRREFDSMKQNGDFDDYYDEDMTKEEIKRRDESIIEELMTDDDVYKYFNMYEFSDFEELERIGLDADSVNRKKILKLFETNSRLYVQDGRKVWDKDDSNGEIVAYVNIVDYQEYENWKRESV